MPIIPFANESRFEAATIDRLKLLGYEYANSRELREQPERYGERPLRKERTLFRSVGGKQWHVTVENERRFVPISERAQYHGGYSNDQ